MVVWEATFFIHLLGPSNLESPELDEDCHDVGLSHAFLFIVQHVETTSERSMMFLPRQVDGITSVSGPACFRSSCDMEGEEF